MERSSLSGRYPEIHISFSVHLHYGSILSRWRISSSGWSRRRIARGLGIHRKTVASYVGGPKPPISTTGSGENETAKIAISTTGSVAGRVSVCREYLSTIAAAVSAGLSATRIHQDLVTDHGFTGSYESVKRCVRSLVQLFNRNHSWRLAGLCGRRSRDHRNFIEVLYAWFAVYPATPDDFDSPLFSLWERMAKAHGFSFSQSPAGSGGLGFRRIDLP